tara:strand:+ start:347 stop:487 length:141 start_codon:yes stop_codon:yes gene_type:complete
MILFAIAFGEMDLSPLTIVFLGGLTLFVFSGVAISTLSLFRTGKDN